MKAKETSFYEWQKKFSTAIKNRGGLSNALDQCQDMTVDVLSSKNDCAVFDTNITRIGFKLASLELTRSSLKILDKVAESLLSMPNVRVEVQAHTDSQGEIENNQKLSESRAESVVNYLVSKGVAKDRLVAKGYGESKPLVSNKLPEGRAQNRRVEFYVISSGQ